MEKKSYISSFLREDFGVEDLIAGRTSSNSFGMEDFDVVNKLGLMSALNDTNNTDPTNFGVESAILLGEAKQFSLFATQKLGEMNERFAICADIKRQFGVEGLDPLAYGAEGFVDGIKKVGAAILAGLKKIVQSVMNFIRSVGNAIGSTLALTQVKLYEQNKGKKFAAGKGGEIKAATHKIKFTQYFVDANKGISEASRLMEESAAEIMSVLTAGPTEESIKKTSVIKMKIKKGQTDFFTNIAGSIQGGINDTSSPSELVRLAVFGSKDAKPTKMKAGDYLAAIAGVDGLKILSREYLDSCKIMVKIGQGLVKTLNSNIKRVDASMKLVGKVAGTKSVAGSKDGAKTNAKAIKLSREAFNSLNLNTSVSGQLSSALLISFSSFLKCRGYCASAVRAYSKESKDKK